MLPAAIPLAIPRDLGNVCADTGCLPQHTRLLLCPVELQRIHPATLRPLSAYFYYTDEYASGNCPLLIDALRNGSYPIAPGNGSTIGHRNRTGRPYDIPNDYWVTPPSPPHNPPSGSGHTPFVRARRPPCSCVMCTGM